MLRTIAVVGFILGLIIAATFSTGWLNSGKDQPADTSQPACDLLEEPCAWETKSGPWQADLSIIENQGQGTEYQLTVHAPVSPDRFLAVLRGESMYMGEYPVPLRRDKKGKYSAQFTAPLCTTGSEMLWRVDLQKGQQPLAEIPPLTLTFQAEQH